MCNLALGETTASTAMVENEERRGGENPQTGLISASRRTAIFPLLSTMDSQKCPRD